MCVNESLRLFPAVARLDRLAKRDAVLKGIHLPKGGRVIVPVYHMHHFAEIYPDPDKFLPERFVSILFFVTSLARRLCF